MSWKLFLDQERFPPEASWLIARSVDEAMALIGRHGYPAEMSLEFELGEHQPTGLDFLKRISAEVLSAWPAHNFQEIELSCHAHHVEGRCKMMGFWKSFQNKLQRQSGVRAQAQAQLTANDVVQPGPGQQQRPKLVVAIASRALFDLDESHRIFMEQGAEAYSRHQIEQEEVPLQPGVALQLVRKLLALNTEERRLVDVTLISRNSADTGLRIFNSIRHHGLDITRAVFTRGESPYRYIEAFGAHLFLSATQEDVQKALEAGIAAATIMPSTSGDGRVGQLRIAFDGDAVLYLSRS